MSSLELTEIDLPEQDFLKLVRFHIQKQDQLTQQIFEEKLGEYDEQSIGLEQIKDILFHTIVSKQTNVVLEQYIFEYEQQNQQTNHQDTNNNQTD